MAVEVRTINSRYFKLVGPLRRRLSALGAGRSRASCGSTSSRGTVQVSLRVDRAAGRRAFASTPACWPAIASSSTSSCPSAVEAADSRCRCRVAAAAAGRGRSRTPASAADVGDRLAAGASRRSRRRWPTWIRCGPTKAGRWRPTWRPTARTVAAELTQIEAPRRTGRRRLSRAADRAAEQGAGRVRGHARAGRPDPRSQHLRRAQRHLRGDRPAAQPSGAVRRRS